MRNGYFWDPYTLEYFIPHGEMIRLLRACGFEVEDLVEFSAPPDATTPSDPLATAEWARRWPIEEAWKARKHDSVAPHAVSS